MVQYLDEAASIISDLDALNEVVPERDVINAVVRGLPAEFSSLIQHILYHDVPLTLNQISCWLNAEELNLAMESKLALADSTTQTTYTALYAAGQGGGGRQGRRCTPRRR